MNNPLFPDTDPTWPVHPYSETTIKWLTSEMKAAIKQDILKNNTHLYLNVYPDEIEYKWREK